MFTKQLAKQGIKKVDGKLVVDLVLKDPVKRACCYWYPWDLSFSKYGLFYKGSPRVMKALKAALLKQGIHLADSQIVLARVPKRLKVSFPFPSSCRNCNQTYVEEQFKYSGYIIIIYYRSPHQSRSSVPTSQKV